MRFKTKCCQWRKKEEKFLFFFLFREIPRMTIRFNQKFVCFVFFFYNQRAAFGVLYSAVIELFGHINQLVGSYFSFFPNCYLFLFSALLIMRFFNDNELLLLHFSLFLFFFLVRYKITESGNLINVYYLIPVIL